MSECEAGGCGISCEFGCSCLENPSTGGCYCSCENQSLPAFEILRVTEEPNPEMYVNFTAAEMPLIQLAELFDVLFPGQIMIPASKARSRITTGEILRQIKLEDLIGHLGLIPIKKPLLGRHLVNCESDT
jgi:hypothetical protein